MHWTPEKIKHLREKLFDETQEEFAKRLGITKFALRIWEQGQAAPSEMAAILLTRIEKDFHAGVVDPPIKQPA